MPVNLPPQPVGLDLPNQPQNPPNLDDVIAAKRYQDKVDSVVALQPQEGPTNVDAARADIYKTEVVITHSAIGAAPAWFVPAMNEVLVPIRTIVAKARNHQLDDGSFSPFEIVPFLNGSMPTQHPHNLPPLTTANAIRNLTGAQATAYANGYGLGAINQVGQRRKAIGRFVGCTVSI